MVFGIAAILATGLSIFALGERSRAQENLLLAEQRSDAIQSRVLMDEALDLQETGNYTLSLMLALEAVQFENAPDVVLDSFEEIATGIGIVEHIDFVSEIDVDERLWSLDGRYILLYERYLDTAIADDSFSLFRLETAEPIQTFSEHDGGVIANSVSPNQRILITSGTDGQTILWDMATGTELRRLDGIASGMRWADNETVYFWYTQSTGDPTLETDWLSNLTGSEILAFNIGTGTLETVFDTTSPDNIPENTQQERVVSASISPDFSHALLAFESTTNLTDGSLSPHAVALINLETGQLVERYRRAVSGRFLSDDVMAITYDDSSVAIRRVNSAEVIGTFTGVALDTSISGDEFMVYDTENDLIYFRDTGNNQELAEIRLPLGYSSNVDFSVRTFGQQNFVGVLTASGFDLIHLVKPDTSPIFTVDVNPVTRTYVADIAYSPDGYRLLNVLGNPYDQTNTEDSRQFYMWGARTGILLHTFSGHDNDVLRLDVSPDGNYVLSGSADTTMILWNLATGDIIHRFEAHTDLVSGVSFSPDGTMALSASKDARMILWDVETGEMIREFTGHTGWVKRGEFSPDGRFIVSVANDGYAFVWDVASGEIIHRLSHITREEDDLITWVSDAEFSPDGQFIISASTVTVEDGSEHFAGLIALWDSETGEMIRNYDYDFNRDGSLFEVGFSPDGQFITTSESWSLIIREVETGEIVWEYLVPEVVRSSRWELVDIEFSPDGQYLAASDDRVHVWDISSIGISQDNDVLNRVYENRYIRDFTCEERERYLIEPLCE